MNWHVCEFVCGDAVDASLGERLRNRVASCNSISQSGPAETRVTCETGVYFKTIAVMVKRVQGQDLSLWTLFINTRGSQEILFLFVDIVLIPNHRNNGLMARSDFSLAAQRNPLEETQESEDTDKFHFRSLDVGNKLFDLTCMINEDEICGEVYVPINFIPHGFTPGLAASASTNTSTIDCMDIDAATVPVSQDRFEPGRRLKDFSPPKRFHRTFWRSAARKILALSSTSLMMDGQNTNI